MRERKLRHVRVSRAGSGARMLGGARQRAVLALSGAASGAGAARLPGRRPHGACADRPPAAPAPGGGAGPSRAPPPHSPPGPGRPASAPRPALPLSAWPAGSAVEAAAAALRAGGLVAVPTDTVYGVACLAQDSRALAALYRLKGRAGSKPLAICLPDLEHVYRYCNVSVPEELLHDLLPGPVTLVLERSEALNKYLNPFTPQGWGTIVRHNGDQDWTLSGVAEVLIFIPIIPGSELVGIRIPSHWFTRELARVCAAPLALTSANLSDAASTLTVMEFQDLWPHLSLVIDGGPIGDIHGPECRLGSTVVDLSVPGRFKVIRPGCALTQTVEILATKHGLSAELPGL